MNREERIEKLAEWLCLNTENRTSEYWYNLVDRTKYFWMGESLLVFEESALGCAWLSSDQSWPEDVDRDTAHAFIRAGWHKVEG